MYYAHIRNGVIAYIYISDVKHFNNDIPVYDSNIIEKYITSPTIETSPYDKLFQENKLLKAQLQAQTERSDFIEDCIAEMAGVIYNTEETTT